MTRSITVHFWQDSFLSILESASVFNASKAYAILGTGMVMVVWFGGFIVIGGALFQMWQTQIGAGALDDAFIFAATGGLVLLFVSRSDA